MLKKKRAQQDAPLCAGNSIGDVVWDGTGTIRHSQAQPGTDWHSSGTGSTTAVGRNTVLEERGDSARIIERADYHKSASEW